MDHDHPLYKWVVLSNTTLGTLLATINASIVLISLPAIFRGIGLNPLAPGNVSYLLWMLMGYLVVTAVCRPVRPARRHVRPGPHLQPRLRRLHARCRRAVLRPAPPRRRRAVADRLAGRAGRRRRDADGVSSAILTDAFPSNQRGMALGVNMVAAVAGSFLGLLIGGLLSEWHWKAVFWVGVPIGILGTIWSVRSLQRARRPHAGRSTGRASCPSVSG